MSDLTIPVPPAAPQVDQPVRYRAGPALGTECLPPFCGAIVLAICCAGEDTRALLAETYSEHPDIGLLDLALEKLVERGFLEVVP